VPPSDWFPEMECPKSSKIHLTIKTYMVLGCHHFRNPPIVSAWVYYSLQLQFYPPSSWGKKTTPIISAWADYFFTIIAIGLNKNNLYIYKVYYI
jgi:hypothetical protein